MRATKFLRQFCKTLSRALRPRVPRRGASADVASKFDVVSAPSTGRSAFSEADNRDEREADESDSDEEIVLLRGSCYSDFEHDDHDDGSSDCATVVADSIYESHANPQCFKGVGVASDVLPSHSRALAVIDPIAKLQHDSLPHVNSEVEKELFDGISPAFLTIMHCGGTASRRRRFRAPAVTDVDPRHARVLA